MYDWSIDFWYEKASSVPSSGKTACNHAQSARNAQPVRFVQSSGPKSNEVQVALSAWDGFGPGASHCFSLPIL
jgi:hypothetical protein